MSDIQLRIYNSDQYHEQVAPFCDSLARNAIYQSPAFSRAWMESHMSGTKEGRQVVFLSFWRNETMIGLFPLCIYRFGLLRVALPLGRDPVSCHGLMHDADYSETSELLAEQISKQKLFNLLYINDLCDHDPATNELCRCLKNQKWSIHSIYRNCCYGVEVQDSLDHLKQSYGERKSFQKLLRKEKKLYKDFDVEVECLFEQNGSPGIIDRIIGIQQESWLRNRGNFMLKQNPHYQKLILNSLQANDGCVYFLKLNQEDAAFAFGIRSEDKLCLLWTAFKEKYASNYSIGVMLMMHIIKNASNSEHIKTCYFCHGDSEWKRRLANHSLNISRTIVAFGTLPKIAALCFYQMCRLHKNEYINAAWMKVKKVKCYLARTMNA